MKRAAKEHASTSATRRNPDPASELPFTEGHATRQAWAQGYPYRDDGRRAQLAVTIEAHGIRDRGDERIPTRITIHQSDRPKADGAIDIAAQDIPILIATLTKAYAIAKATGVVEAYTPWVDAEDATARA